MSVLDGLSKMDGVLMACEFTPDGKLKDFKANTDVPREIADKAAEYISTVTLLFNTLAGSFSQLSGMKWVPQQGWTYTGGDWTVVAGGNHAVFVETAKADFDQLHEALIQQKIYQQVSQSI